jgi:hypothetical protein
MPNAISRHNALIIEENSFKDRPDMTHYGEVDSVPERHKATQRVSGRRAAGTDPPVIAPRIRKAPARRAPGAGQPWQFDDSQCAGMALSSG